MKRAILPVCLLLSVGLHALLFTCRLDSSPVDPPAPVLVQMRGSASKTGVQTPATDREPERPAPQEPSAAKEVKRTLKALPAPVKQPPPPPPEEIPEEVSPVDIIEPIPLQETLSGADADPSETESRPAVRIEAAPIGDYTKPPYPGIAEKRGWEGEVLVRVGIEIDGTVAAVAVDRSSGYPVLDRRALTWVETWRFAPATVDGSPVSSEVIAPVRFVLKEN